MSRTRRGSTRWRPATRWRHAVPPGSCEPYIGELVRLISDELDVDSREPLGIFQIAARLHRSGGLDPEVDGRLLEALRWFSANLSLPRRFSHHRDGHRRTSAGQWIRKPIAVSWFKPDATVHLKRIREVAGFIRSAGLVISEITTTNPGYITYEDRYQVVAVPFQVGDGPSEHGYRSGIEGAS